MTSTDIALLVYDFRASGVVRNALRIARAARKASLDISLWPIRLQGDLMADIPASVPVRPILAGATRMQRDIDSLLAVPTLAKAIRERRPRVLFSGGNQAHLHAALALRRIKGREDISFIGRASNALICTGAGGLSWRRIVQPIERFQFAGMDRIVAVSAELGLDLTEHFGLGDRVTVIPNGVDLDQVGAAASTEVSHPFFADTARPVILSIGRLSWQKDFATLMRAFALVRDSVPARLLILGPGDAAWHRRLRALAQELGIGSDVDLAGFVSNPAAWLKRASLFVLSSRWEGASNALLEALACGCPVVATRAAGVAEMLREGQIGPLVPVGDHAALASAMLARLAAPRGSDALRARAADYGLDQTLGAYVGLLNDVLGAGSPNGLRLPPECEREKMVASQASPADQSRPERGDIPKWTAILLAGQRPGGDPLALHFGLASKALISVAGVSMLRRVVETLLKTPEVGRVVILAQDPDALLVGDAAPLRAYARVIAVRSGPGIATSIANVAGSIRAPWPVLVTTVDHVLLTQTMVSEFLAGATECDVAVGFGARSIVEKAYPETRRTWLRFSDGDFSGANLFALRNAKAGAALAVWADVEQHRKNVWKLFRRFGPFLLIRALTRSIALGRGLRRAGSRIGIAAMAVILSAPEAAIDVDKLDDLVLAEAILSKRPSDVDDQRYTPDEPERLAS